MEHSLHRLVADARFPSLEPGDTGGLGPAMDEGAVVDPAGLAGLLHGRLATVGTIGAFAAAMVCARAAGLTSVHSPFWGTVEAELDARIPSPAMRRAWRDQGGRLLRVALEVSDAPLLQFLARATVRHQQRPHHPVVVGAIACVAGNSPADAAAAAAWASLAPAVRTASRTAGLASSVPAVLGGLNPAVERLVEEAVARCLLPPAGLPCPSAAGLAWLADAG